MFGGIEIAPLLVHYGDAYFMHALELALRPSLDT